MFIKDIARRAEDAICWIQDHVFFLLLGAIVILFAKTIIWPNSLDVFILLLLVLVLSALCK